MSRRAAIVTQADVTRVVRGAKIAGAHRVVVQRDGTMIIMINGDGEQPDLEPEVVDERPVVL